MDQENENPEYELCHTVSWDKRAIKYKAMVFVKNNDGENGDCSYKGSVSRYFDDREEAKQWCLDVVCGAVEVDFTFRCREEGIVYAIGAGDDHVTIGVSQSDHNLIQFRLKSHQRGNHKVLRVLGVYRCKRYYAKESELHKLLHDRVSEGHKDWFNVSYQELQQKTNNLFQDYINENLSPSHALPTARFQDIA